MQIPNLREILRMPIFEPAKARQELRFHSNRCPIPNQNLHRRAEWPEFQTRNRRLSELASDPRAADTVVLFLCR